MPIFLITSQEQFPTLSVVSTRMGYLIRMLDMVLCQLLDLAGRGILLLFIIILLPLQSPNLSPELEMFEINYSATVTVKPLSHTIFKGAYVLLKYNKGPRNTQMQC